MGDEQHIILQHPLCHSLVLAVILLTFYSNSIKKWQIKVKFEKKTCMETTIKINTDLLNTDIIEGIQKMFPHKTVEIKIQEEYQEDEEDATQFILNRPQLAAELQKRIDSIENMTAKLISVKAEDLL